MRGFEIRAKIEGVLVIAACEKLQCPSTVVIQNTRIYNQTSTLHPSIKITIIITQEANQ